MIALNVVYRFAPEKVDEAIGYFEKMQPASRAEAGCLFYTVYRDRDDDCTFIIHEQWQDQAALEAHGVAPHMQQYAINGLRKIALSRSVNRIDPLFP
ncbi:MAG: antibiotic biosynthesis monooxygenase [Candidatus Eremiobacteraeota bacterium]|nr:antibiotic biosynthesis monooxygenase [Candidatus Eremiobacteraeota bacterium]